MFWWRILIKLKYIKKKYNLISGFLNQPSSIKSFVTESTIYTIFNVVNKAIPFLLLPYITRIVTTEDFGYYSLFITVETMIIPLVSMNTHVAISSHFYKDVKLKEYISTVVFMLVGFCIIFLFLLSNLPSVVTQWIGISKNHLYYVVIIATFMALFSLISNLFRLQRDPKSYGWFTILNSLFLFLFIIGATLIKGDRDYIIGGRLFFTIAFFVFCIKYLIKKDFIGLTIVKAYLKLIIKFSLPTVIYSLSAFLFLLSDRFLINHYLGKTAVGLYSGIFQIASIISILCTSFNAAWMPWLFDKLKTSSVSEYPSIVKISYFLMSLFIIISLAYSMIYGLIVSVILPDIYHEYIYIGYPLIFAYAFEGIYLIVSPYIFYKEKTKYNGYIGLLVAVVNISLNVILIPHLGIYGAALSTLFTWISLALLFFIFSNKVFPLPWLNFFHIKHAK